MTLTLDEFVKDQRETVLVLDLQEQTIAQKIGDRYGVIGRGVDKHMEEQDFESLAAFCNCPKQEVRRVHRLVVGPSGGELTFVVNVNGIKRLAVLKSS